MNECDEEEHFVGELKARKKRIRAIAATRLSDHAPVQRPWGERNPGLTWAEWLRMKGYGRPTDA